MDTLKFERDVSLQTEDTVHDNSSQTDQQQWIHQLLIQMNQRLDEIESLSITTDNIIDGKICLKIFYALTFKDGKKLISFSFQFYKPLMT